MHRRNERRSMRRSSDVWMFPGMDRSRGGDDWYGRYYDSGNRYYEQREPQSNPRSGGGYHRHYRDPDIYEQEIGRREYPARYDDQYDGHRRHDDDDRGPNFFERAGQRIREIWDEWNGHPRHEYPRDDRHDHRGYFDAPFSEDHNERRYGRDNWAPNANRGYSGRRRTRQPDRRSHYYHEY